MTKLTNDQNIKNLHKRKILRYFIIACGFVTIILSVLSLVIKLHFIFPVIAFAVMTILTKIRENIPIKISKTIEMKRVEKALEKQKNKKNK